MSDLPEHDGFPEDRIIAELYFHIIFWTRKLQPALSQDTLAGACERLDQTLFTVEGEVLAAGGTANHLHILARLSPDHSVQEALDAIRRRLATWAADAGGIPWHEDDIVLSISPRDLNAARGFIESQKSHHEIVSVQSELTAILDEHGLDYDERELWG